MIAKPFFSAFVLLAATAGAAMAMSNAGHDHFAAAPFGQPGDPAKPARAIPIEMREDFDHGKLSYAPEKVEVKAGEQVRFTARNVGTVEHEMILGSLDDLKAHAAEMASMPDMVHEQPNGLVLAAGARGEMLWRFAKPGVWYLACLKPGHLEMGMIARVEVK